MSHKPAGASHRPPFLPTTPEDRSLDEAAERLAAHFEAFKGDVTQWLGYMHKANVQEIQEGHARIESRIASEVSQLRAEQQQHAQRVEVLLGDLAEGFRRLSDAVNELAAAREASKTSA